MARHLAGGQRGRNRGEPFRTAGKPFGRVVLGMAHDLEAACEAGRHHVVLVVVVMVERALRHVQVSGDLVHRRTAISLLVDQDGCGTQERLGGDLAVSCRRGPERQWSCRRPVDAVGKDAADQHVREAFRRARIFLNMVAPRQLLHGHEYGQQEMRPAVLACAVPIAVALRPDQPPEAAEHIGIGVEATLHLRARERAYVVEEGNLRVVAPLNRRKQREIGGKEPADAIGRCRFRLRCRYKAVDDLHGRQQACRCEVLLFPVVIGDAVGHQAHRLRDVAQRRALHAALVEEPRTGVEDRLALLLVPARFPDAGRYAAFHGRTRCDAIMQCLGIPHFRYCGILPIVFLVGQNG